MADLTGLRASSTKVAFNTEPSFKRTLPPNPEWKKGEPVKDEAWKADEEKGWSKFTPGEDDNTFLYKLLISGVTPRPIAFVASTDGKGVHNLSPFSYFSLISHNPALVTISFAQFAERQKDTSLNIRSTKEFTVSIISEPWVENANWTAIDAPIEHDEWAGSGLTQVASDTIKVPRVKESAFSMECVLEQAHDFTDPKNPDLVTTTLVIGRVKRIHVRNAVLDPETNLVDPAKFKAISRLGDITYARVGEGFQLRRPRWDEESGAN